MLDLPLDYPVYCEAGCLGRLRETVGRHAPSHRVVIIADASVWRLYGPVVAAQWHTDDSDGGSVGASVDRSADGSADRSADGSADGSAGSSADAARGDLLVLEVPPGEKEKSRERWAQLSDAMMAWGAGRDTSVVAFGGGVTGDLAGFVAATYMRGVPVVQVPTTLLAMVDASVGGKTAVDTPAGKNLVGAFHNPSAVVVDPSLLRSLPGEVLRSGLAEMIKHGVIADPDYLDRLEAALPLLVSEGADTKSATQTENVSPVGVTEAFTALIARSIEIKAGVVARDPQESGLRAILNFGHTIAHAVEKLHNYNMLHGEAVAVGMVAEATLAERLGLAGPGLAARVEKAVRAARLPTRLPAGMSPKEVLKETRGDKKVKSGTLRYALPRAPGEMEVSIPVPDGMVLAVLGALIA